MKRFHLFVIALMPISLFGCRATFSFGQLALTTAGVVGESSKTPGKYVLGDLTKTRVPQGSLRIVPPLHLQHPLRTEEVVKATVFQVVGGNTYHYNVLLGPKLCPDTGPRLCGNTAKGSVKEPPVGAPHQGAPAFHLDQGWAFLWTNPSVAVAKTKWVIGATCGSTMVVQIVDATEERVFFLEGKDVKVTCLMPGSTKSVTLNTVGEYFKIEEEKNDCKFNGPYKIKGSVLEPFITELEKIAETAGWTP